MKWLLLLFLLSGCAYRDLPRDTVPRYYKIDDQLGNRYLMMIPPHGKMEIIKIYPSKKGLNKHGLLF